MNVIHPVQGYPLDAFHNLVRDALYEVGCFAQVPEALVANAFIATMSVACQRHVDVKLPMGQVRPVSVNVATIADSGERKTAVDSLVCAPIYARMNSKYPAYDPSFPSPFYVGASPRWWEHQIAEWLEHQASLSKKTH